MIILLFIAMACVLVILGLGLFTLAKGGEFSAKWSNRLMRYRVLAQAIALILVGLIVLMKQ